MTKPAWMSDPRWSDEKIREACLNRCGADGDPACFEMNGQGPVEKPYDNAPCGECLRDVGIEPGDEFDEGAAIGRML